MYNALVLCFGEGFALVSRHKVRSYRYSAGLNSVQYLCELACQRRGQ